MRALLEHTFRFVFGIGLWLGPIPAFGAMAQLQLDKFDLSNCNETDCIVVKAQSAVRSQIKDLYFMRSVRLVTTDLKGNTKLEIQAETGYFDFDTQLVVLKDPVGKTKGSEFGIHLKTHQLLEWGNQ